MVVLDTDLLSLLERDRPEAATLRRRLRGVEARAVVTTIINFEEQMRGPVLDFDARAAVEFQRLRKEYRRE